MSPTEYAAWKRKMAQDAGRWVVDPVHPGTQEEGRRNLLAYCASPEDNTRGIYVMLEQKREVADGKEFVRTYLTTGSFEDALPHIGEGAFLPKYQSYHFSWSGALGRAESLRLSFLKPLLRANGVPLE